MKTNTIESIRNRWRNVLNVMRNITNGWRPEEKKVSHRELGVLFDVSHSTIGGILRNIYWVE